MIWHFKFKINPNKKKVSNKKSVFPFSEKSLTWERLVCVYWYAPLPFQKPTQGVETCSLANLLILSGPSLNQWVEINTATEIEYQFEQAVRGGGGGKVIKLTAENFRQVSNVPRSTEINDGLISFRCQHDDTLSPIEWIMPTQCRLIVFRQTKGVWCCYLIIITKEMNHSQNIFI